MIKFFNKIRQQLIDQSKVSKYLLYAFGEIILVVIGILIALQINNWNQDRQNREREQMYLNGLMGDLNESQKELQRVFNKTESIAKAVTALLKYESDTVPLPTAAVYDSLINDSFGYTIAMTNEGTIEDIMGSGDLKVIRNDSLRRRIASWESGFKMIRERETLLRNEFLKELDLFNPIMDALGHSHHGKPLISKKNQRRILQDTLFRNSFANMIMTCRVLNHYYDLKLKEIDTFIQITRQELKKK